VGIRRQGNNVNHGDVMISSQRMTSRCYLPPAWFAFHCCYYTAFQHRPERQ